MSYVVHLWEEASPSSLHEADRLHERLAGTAAAANPKFAQLSRALIERFPAEVGGRGEQGESWVESPPDGRTDTRVYSLGLYGGGIDRLLPVLVTEAMALGLTVYDDQAGRAYLPGGWVLDHEGRHALDQSAVTADPGITMAQAKARYQAVVVPALQPFGFRFQSDKGQWHLTRTCPLGEQRITLAVRDGAYGLEFQPTGSVTPVLPPGLAPAIGPSVRVRFETRDCEPIEYRFWLNRDQPRARHDLRTFVVDNAAALDDFLQSYRDLLLRSVRPFLDATQTAPAFVDASLRPDAWQASFKPLYATLAVAHWLGSADFDALVETIAASMGGDPGTLRILATIVGRLEASPQHFGTYPEMNAA
jgi:hypothetical protein